VNPVAAMDVDALRAQLAPGHATISGQAFSKTVGGDVKYGAGNTIILWPKTAYTTECLAMLGANTYCGEKLTDYARTVRADGEGRFVFGDLKPGSYIVWTMITWGVPGPYGISTTGGMVSGFVDVKSDVDMATVYLD